MDWFKAESLYYEDDAVNLAGEAAEVLFMRANGWSTDRETRGFIPDHQLARFGLKSVERRAAALVREQLWVEVPGGWQIRSYERIQEEVIRIIERKRAEAERKRRAYRERKGVSAEIAAEYPQQSPDDSRKSPSLVSGNESLQEVETEIGDFSPNPTQSAGSSCAKHNDKPHPNCKGCKTNPRAVRAEAAKRGPWCGACDEDTRMFYDEEERPTRCSCATPTSLRAVS